MYCILFRRIAAAADYCLSAHSAEYQAMFISVQSADCIKATSFCAPVNLHRCWVLNSTRKRVVRVASDLESTEVELQAGSAGNSRTDAVSMDTAVLSNSPVTGSASKQRTQTWAKVSHRHRGVGAARPQHHHHHHQQQQQAVRHPWIASACGSRPPSISTQQPDCTVSAGNSAAAVTDVTTLLSDGD